MANNHKKSQGLPVCRSEPPSGVFIFENLLEDLDQKTKVHNQLHLTSNIYILL